MAMFLRFKMIFVLLLVMAAASSVSAKDAAVKNVILMITDGSGFNSYDAASYYQYGELGHQIYDAFPVRLGCTTYMLINDGQPTGYSPAFWDDFDKVRKGEGDMTPTDSAAAATAFNTGVKTTYGRISKDHKGIDLLTIAEIAHQQGKRTGAISSVPFSHATPACVDAHHDSRHKYEEIAREMIYGSDLSVIMGGGHPLFDDDGKPSSSPDYHFVGGKETFEALVNNTTGKGWTLIQTREEFERIAKDPKAAPDRLIGIPQVRQTLQINRKGNDFGNFIQNVPDLSTMALAALNTLNNEDKGLFLMIEGGAVDWANHGNRLERMLEEQIDFNHTVEAVVKWVEKNSSWDETLLIITSDHECGMVWGEGTFENKDDDRKYNPGKDKFIAWKAVKNNGKGKVPGVVHCGSGHTNALVPLYAKGRGSEMFTQLIDGKDPEAGRRWRIKEGAYVDNTDVVTVMKAAVLPHEKVNATTP